MGANYALSINIKFEDPNNKSPGKRGCVRNNVDTVDMKTKAGFEVRSGSDEQKGKDAGRKRGESTKKVVDEILGFDRTSGTNSPTSKIFTGASTYS
ncbi:hypothetical protein QR685DRAFT_557523 [Neurospora intermedia]|uniref:Uncharacterized protein n=1 Tax=Neurospora intermedia TaxID=5142 RepID=A0ABR3D0A5_NEUIN